MTNNKVRKYRILRNLDFTVNTVQKLIISKSIMWKAVKAFDNMADAIKYRIKLEDKHGKYY